jgi:hypothetical protein
MNQFESLLAPTAAASNKTRSLRAHHITWRWNNFAWAKAPPCDLILPILVMLILVVSAIWRKEVAE